MKKSNLLLIIILTTLNLPTLCFAGLSQSQSFRVSVTLPAVVGLNVFPENQGLKLTQGPTQNITREMTRIEDKEVILETIVLK